MGLRRLHSNLLNALACKYDIRVREGFLKSQLICMPREDGRQQAREDYCAYLECSRRGTKGNYCSCAGK